MTRAPAVDRELAESPSWTPRPAHLWWVAAAVVVAAAALLLAPRLESPAPIAEVTFVNPTGYDVTIKASDGSAGDGLTPVGTVEGEETAVFEQVFDQGDRWVFHFTSQGRDGGTLESTRAELAASGWQVEIPASVGATLADAGAPEPR